MRLLWIAIICEIRSTNGDLSDFPIIRSGIRRFEVIVFVTRQVAHRRRLLFETILASLQILELEFAALFINVDRVMFRRAAPSSIITETVIQRLILLVGLIKLLQCPRSTRKCVARGAVDLLPTHAVPLFNVDDA